METKDTLSKMEDSAWQIMRDVQKAIEELTAENPLILFNKDEIESDDDLLYELPYAYYVGKYEYYNEGTIWKVCGKEVTMLLRGEEFGETWQLELNQIPFESLVSLLTYLKERL